MAAAGRELLWGLRSVRSELGAWRRYAQVIPDAPLREDALGSLARKRTHADGAALFSILPRRRDPRLLRLLVAYESVWISWTTSMSAWRAVGNGHQLHLALVEALDPQRSDLGLLPSSSLERRRRLSARARRDVSRWCAAAARILAGALHLCRETVRALGVGHQP